MSQTNLREIESKLNLIFKFLLSELKQSTDESEHQCWQVAERLTAEIARMYHTQQPLKNPEKIEVWLNEVTRNYLQNCLNYYYLKPEKAHIKLQIILTKMSYSYINSPQSKLSEQAQQQRMDKFIHQFYQEALKNWRQEAKIDQTYLPKTDLEIAEFLAYTERYAKRGIALPNYGSQTLIGWWAKHFSEKSEEF